MAMGPLGAVVSGLHAHNKLYLFIVFLCNGLSSVAVGGFVLCLVII